MTGTSFLSGFFAGAALSLGGMCLVVLAFYLLFPGEAEPKPYMKVLAYSDSRYAVILDPRTKQFEFLPWEEFRDSWSNPEPTQNHEWED